MTTPDFGMTDLTVTAAHQQDGQVALRFADDDRIGALIVRYELGRAPALFVLAATVAPGQQGVRRHAPGSFSANWATETGA